MRKTMRKMMKETAINCVRTFKPTDEYKTFNEYYQKQICEKICQELNAKGLDCKTEKRENIFEVNAALGKRNYKSVLLKIKIDFSIRERVTEELIEEYFPNNVNLVTMHLITPHNISDIGTNIDYYVDEYFDEALEECYQIIEYETQQVLDILHQMLNAKEALLEVDSIRNREE